MNLKNKRVSLILALVSAFALQSFSSKHNEMKSKKTKTMTISKTSEVINASADKLWEITGPGFGDVGKWSTNVDHAEASGTPEFEGAVCSSRSCDLNAKGFSKINERITAYDAQNRTLSFNIDQGTPGFVTDANSTWEIIKVSETTSKIRVTSTLELKRFMGSLMGGMLEKNLNSVIPTIISDLKIYAETGEISESKKARIASLNK